MEGNICVKGGHLQLTLPPRERSGLAYLPLQPGGELSKKQNGDLDPANLFLRGAFAPDLFCKIWSKQGTFYDTFEICLLASLVAQLVKNPPVGDVGSIPGWEKSVEKRLATHSSILAWRIISWTEETGKLHTLHGITKSWTRLNNFHVTGSVKADLQGLSEAVLHCFLALQLQGSWSPAPGPGEAPSPMKPHSCHPPSSPPLRHTPCKEQRYLLAAHPSPSLPGLGATANHL